jgi:hypothetical protein
VEGKSEVEELDMDEVEDKEEEIDDGEEECKEGGTEEEQRAALRAFEEEQKRKEAKAEEKGKRWLDKMQKKLSMTYTQRPHLGALPSVNSYEVLEAEEELVGDMGIELEGESEAEEVEREQDGEDDPFYPAHKKPEKPSAGPWKRVSGTRGRKWANRGSRAPSPEYVWVAREVTLAAPASNTEGLGKRARADDATATATFEWIESERRFMGVWVQPGASLEDVQELRQPQVIAIEDNTEVGLMAAFITLLEDSEERLRLPGLVKLWGKMSQSLGAVGRRGGSVDEKRKRAAGVALGSKEARAEAERQFRLDAFSLFRRWADVAVEGRRGFETEEDAERLRREWAMGVESWQAISDHLARGPYESKGVAAATRGKSRRGNTLARGGPVLRGWC